MQTFSKPSWNFSKVCRCGKELTPHHIHGGVFYYCENAGIPFKIEGTEYTTHRHEFHYEFICKTHGLQAVKMKQKNGVYICREQCRNCGHSPGRSIKRPNGWESLPDFIPEGERPIDAFYIEIQGHKERYYEKEERAKKEWDAIQKGILRERYNIYLNTDEWRRRRKLVLKRDKYTCQCCCEREATEVHHLTYENFGREPLWDLVGICGQCHQQFKGTKLK